MRWQVIDGDGHISEDLDDVWGFLEEPYRSLKRPKLHGLWPSLDGRFRTGSGIAETTAETWRQFLQETGIGEAVLYPTGGLAHGLIQDPDWSVALARAYNNWMAARYTRQDPRLKAVALLPVQDVEAAVAELRRAVTELGCVGGLLPAVTVDHALYGKERYWPLFAEAVRLNRPLVIHGAPQWGLGLEAFDSHLEAHVLEHALPQFKQIVSIVFGGVLEAYPTVRIAFLEAGAGWLPYLVDRMEYEYRARPGQAKKCPRRPSSYFEQDNFFVSCEPEEPSLGYVVQRFGSRGILYASDFPHELSYDEYRHDLEEFLEREDLAQADKAAIVWDNVRRFYGL